LADSALVQLRVLPGGGALAWVIGGIIGLLAANVLLRHRAPNLATRPQSQSLEAANARANEAKLGSVVPELAGRFRRFPEYLTPPHRFFVDKRTQHLRFLACIGPGTYDVESVRVSDTEFSLLGS